MAIKRISEFASATPAASDKILFEQNGSGKSTTIKDAVNTCSLTYNEIMNDSTDLTGKVASASALKSLKPVIGKIAKNDIPLTATLTRLGGMEITIPSNCIFGVHTNIIWSTIMPDCVVISDSAGGSNPNSLEIAQGPSFFSPGSLGCSVSGYNSVETTYYVWARANGSGSTHATLSYWYVRL